jgi:hypothetical protein
MATKTKQAPPAEVPIDADHVLHRQLGLLLFTIRPDRHRAVGKEVIPGTRLEDVHQQATDLLDVIPQARELTNRVREETLQVWRQSAEFAALGELEAKVQTVKAALAAAHQEGVEAEDHYQQSLANEDEPSALKAKRGAQDALAKMDFQTQRLQPLEGKLAEAKQAAQSEQNRLLREAARKLQGEVEEAAEVALPQLGACLARHLPSILLQFEVPPLTRRWT